MRRLPAVLLMLLPFALAASVQAQEPSADAPEQGAVGTDAVDGTVERCRDDLRVMTDDARSLGDAVKVDVQSEDDRNLLRLEIANHLSSLHARFENLTRRIPELPQDAAVTDSIRQTAADILRDLLVIEIDGYDRLLSRIDAMRARRPDTPPSGLGDLESVLDREVDFMVTVLEWIGKSMEIKARLDVDDGWSDDEYDRKLVEAAEDLAGRTQLAGRDRARLRDRLRTVDDAGSGANITSDLQLRLQAVEQRVRGMSDGLGDLLRLMDNRNLPTSKYRSVIVSTTGEVSENILDLKVLQGLLKQAWDGALRWLRDMGPARLIQVAIVLGVIVVFRNLARAAWALSTRSKRARGSRLALDLLGRMVVPFGTLLGLFVGLWVVGADPTAMLTGLGVLSVIIGLALQDTLGNLAAGAFILIYRPYDVDDAIKAGGELGLVKAMGLANTTIVTFDNRRLYIPNRKIWSEVIENRSTESCRRVACSVRISYEDDLQRSLDLIRGFLADHPQILPEPAASVFVTELGASWIEVAVWPWAATTDWWGVHTSLPQQLLELLRSEGIEMPYRRQEVLVVQRSSEPS